MSSEFIVRIVGMVLMAVGGIYLGVYLGNLAAGPPELWAAVFAMVGALMGLVVTPFLTTRPVRAIRSMVAQVSAQTMVAGLIGLIVGLIVAALISFPLSLLPAPFGQLLPFIGALFFTYLGITIFVLRQNDILGLLRSRLATVIENGGSADSGGRNVLLDTSVIIDGRIADIAHTGFLFGPMVVPGFVLTELQHIADSPDGLQAGSAGGAGWISSTGCRRSRACPSASPTWMWRACASVDDKLVILAKQMRCPS